MVAKNTEETNDIGEAPERKCLCGTSFTWIQYLVTSVLFENHAPALLNKPLEISFYLVNMYLLRKKHIMSSSVWLNTLVFGGKLTSKFFWSYFCLVCPSLRGCFLCSLSKNSRNHIKYNLKIAAYEEEQMVHSYNTELQNFSNIEYQVLEL